VDSVASSTVHHAGGEKSLSKSANRAADSYEPKGNSFEGSAADVKTPQRQREYLNFEVVIFVHMTILMAVQHFNLNQLVSVLAN
jgi:hypothetical protein